MSTLPQLIEEDIARLEAILRDLLDASEADTALLTDKGGFLITQGGDTGSFDLTTVAALASGAYLANQTIANLIQEENFNAVYQQGDKHSMLVMNVDAHCLLVLIFTAQISVGAVKYFSARAIQKIAAIIAMAWQRNPEGGLDLSALNLENPDVVFRKKT